MQLAPSSALFTCHAICDNPALGRSDVKGAGTSTYQRVKELLDDGEWHSLDELKAVSSFPERWIEELRRDGLDVVEDKPVGKVALLAGEPAATAG